MKTILVDAVNTFVIKNEGIYKPMFELLERYPNRKIILTNANDKQIEEFGLNKMPYEVFTLKHNPEKIDPVYFETMLKHFGLKSENVIYFEHNPDAVKSAESINIISYHYDSEKQDVDTLDVFLKNNV